MSSGYEPAMRNARDKVCGCFPTGRHYPGIAERIAKAVIEVKGVAKEFAADIDWRTAAIAVIDFETTGLDPAQDRVLEMGVVTFDGGELVEKRNWLINPTIPVPEESRRIHGIGDEDLANAPRFEEIFPEIVGLLSNRLPVAYNANFDKKFFLAEFARLGAALDIEAPPALRKDVTWVDPLVWVRELQKYEKGKKLTDVCARMDIEIGQAHRAADDATATGKVLIALAKDMPRTYGELIRIQTQYEAMQEAERISWRARRK
ncbi:MAG: 3'-5' exonuclease [Deltaproteobacteria bacterium]|nr:MAG: 3'-5' exonuclease [Deltaproteobacteria bacterium]